MKSIIAVICIMTLSLVFAVPAPINEPAKSLFVYCAAGMRKPVETLAKEYETQKGVKIELTYDGSNKLLGQIKLTRKGDVYIAGDADYIDMARKDSLVGATKAVCYFVPVIMVKKGNPKKIASLQNLTVKGLKIGQGDDKAAAVGRIMPKLLQLNTVDSLSWKKNVVLSTPTVNELAMAIKLGTIDATVVWSAIAAPYKDVSEMIAIPIEKNVVPEVGAAVLSFSKEKAEAGLFLEFLGSDKAKQVLNQEGYLTEKPAK